MDQAVDQAECTLSKWGGSGAVQRGGPVDLLMIDQSHPLECALAHLHRERGERFPDAGGMELLALNDDLAGDRNADSAAHVADRRE